MVTATGQRVRSRSETLRCESGLNFETWQPYGNNIKVHFAPACTMCTLNMSLAAGRYTLHLVQYNVHSNTLNMSLAAAQGPGPRWDLTVRVTVVTKERSVK